MVCASGAAAGDSKTGKYLGDKDQEKHWVNFRKELDARAGISIVRTPSNESR